MPLRKSHLYSSLWKSCDELRGGMDASQYKDYVLTLLFMKYVSDKYPGDDEFADITVPPEGSFADTVALKGTKEIGDRINKVIGRLADANDHLLKGVIDLPDFNDETKLGKGKEMQDRLTKLVGIFEGLDFRADQRKWVPTPPATILCPPLDTEPDPMIRTYTDEELNDLGQLPKRVTNPGARWSEKPGVHPVHRQRTFRAAATTEDDQEFRFQIYQRQSLLDQHNYSCGIVYLAPDGTRLTLARYNGSNHQHGGIRFQPHIHRATEAAITDGKKPEHAAEETTRYQTLEGALACLIEDFSLSGIRANPDHPSLFNGHQS